jgi:hypothetical protein
MKYRSTKDYKFGNAVAASLLATSKPSEAGWKRNSHHLSDAKRRPQNEAYSNSLV